MGRHVLAIQDTSEFNFKTTAERQRGLGEIGKGNGRGALAHVMLGLDAQDGSCLGLVSGRIWTRQGRVTRPHGKRPLTAKESERWLSTAEAAKSVLADAAMVTVRIPRHGGHRFRFIAATDSDSSRPPIPTHRGQSFERMIVIAG